MKIRKRRGIRYWIPIALTILLGSPVPLFAQTNIVAWYQDDNVTAGGGTHVHNTDNPYINATYVSSATAMSAAAGVSMTKLATTSAWATFFGIKNARTSSYAQAYLNADYVKANVTIASGSPRIKITRLSFTRFNGDGASTGKYSVALVMRDLATTTYQKVLMDHTIEEYTAATNNGGTSTIPVSDSLALIPGHQYEFLWYIYNITRNGCIEIGSNCSTSAVDRATTPGTSDMIALDNPIIMINRYAHIFGTVRDDNDGTTGGVNGTVLAGATVTLYAPDGTTVKETTTTDANGNYTFRYQLLEEYVVGVTAPSGYEHVSSTDNTPTSGKTRVVLGETDVTGLDFGLNKAPTANNDVLNNQTPGTVATVPNVLSNDVDPNNGTLSAAKIDLYSYLPAGNIVHDANGRVTSFTVAGEGAWALNTTTGAVTFTPQAGFLGDPTAIAYRVTDAAGLTTPLTGIAIDYNAPVAVSGTVFNDNNAGTPDGTPMAGVTVDLYVNNGAFITSTTTDANGNYSFPNLASGTYATRITAPAGYQIVSETDNTLDIWQVLTVGSANISGVNYGLNQPPTAASDLLSSQSPGYAATVPNILSNDVDPNNGTLSADRIDLYSYLPAGNIVHDANGRVTSFTVAGEGAWALNTTSGAVTFTPQSGFSGDPTPIAYRVTDAAGLTTPLTGISIDYNPLATVSGTVFNDNNAGTPDGTGISGINVSLWNNGVSFTTTTDANGNYSFTNVWPSYYFVGVGALAGYQNVSSTDASPTDGYTLYQVGNTNATGINFGVNQPPTAANDLLGSQSPGSAATVINILSNDSDPNGGTLSADKISLVVPSGATGVTTTNGNTTGFTVPNQGAWWLNSGTGAVTFTPQSGFIADPTPIKYKVTDAAALISNEAMITIDYNPLATVSGTVFNDNNAGTPDGTGMSGINVSLWNNGVSFTTTTDANGNYSFTNVWPSYYFVGVGALAGYQNVSSTDASPTDGYTLYQVGNTNATGINFGVNQPPAAVNDLLSGQTPGSAATIPNILSNDTDPNGGTLSKDSISLVTPSGATGITTDVQGDVTGFTVTGQGTWALNSTTGAVTFTPQSGFTADPTPIKYTVTDNAKLTSNEATITIDYNTPATISGTVYNDNNAGTPDGTALAGVTVDLYVNNGAFITSTTTDANGNYSFPNLVPGTYATRITTPAGYQIVSETDNSNDIWQVLTVGSANIPGVNYGLNQPPTAVNDLLSGQTPGSAATIPNILSNDTDPNGGTLSKDSISLVSPSGATGITTDAQGDVTGFTVTGQGTWALNSTTGAVSFTPQSGFTADPTPIKYTVTDNAKLTSNEATITIDYNAPATISGVVFNDNNAGTPDGTALAGVTVELYVNFGALITSTTTDANGNYSFPNLVPGSYATRITTPAGYQIVSETDNTLDVWQVVNLGSTNATGVSYGVNKPAVATNDVLNNQTPGSAAIVPNILSNDSDPNSGTLSADSISLVAPTGATGVTTDAQGDVTGFTVTGQGTWALNSTSGAVTFTPQSGFTADPTPIKYTVTDNAKLISNEATITIDYNTPATISGIVFNDNNAGTPDGTALAGVTVELYVNFGALITSTTTDANGNYSFPNLVPGAYATKIISPAGYRLVGSSDNGRVDGWQVVNLGSTNATGVSYGVNKPAVATNDVLNNQTPGSAAIVPNILSNDSDPNSGTLSADSISLVAPTGATGVTTDAQGDVTGFTVTGQGTWALNSTSGAVTFTPQSGFTADPTPIKYTVTDNAKLTSNEATITIDYNAPATISGIVFNDNNAGTPDGTALTGVTVDLYVNNGAFITTTTTDANGNYSFPNLVPGTYATRITTPAGYQIVSETDNSNDIWQVLTVGSANISGVNYGVNQPPTTVNDIVNNPMGGTTVTVPNILSNDTDPNGGTLTAGKISFVTPSGATNVTTANGNTTGFTVPNQGTWALNTTTGAVTFTPQNGFTADPTPIRYKVTDAAGLISNEATITIDYIPVPDLAPVILLPVNGMNAGESRNFVVRINEVNSVATSSQIAFNISVPAGYTLSFTDTLSNILVQASGTYQVSNNQWNTFNMTGGNIDMQSKPGFVINANSRTYVGFKVTRTSAPNNSVSNISVNIYPDNTRRYDSRNSNNLYHRVITGN